MKINFRQEFRLISNLIIFMSLWCIMITESSCKKDKLPKASQAGANTFGCRINGKDFTPQNHGWFGGDPLFGHIIANGVNGTYAEIYAINTIISPEKEIYIKIDFFNGVGTYELSNDNQYGNYKEYSPDQFYTNRLTRNGKVIITKDDRINHILSGTFEFTALNFNNHSDSVSIRDGRFDYKY